MNINEIHDQFYRALLNFIQSRVSNKEDAEDILQDVFIKISKNIETLSSDDKLKSWIFSITRNSIIDYYRKNSKITAAELSEDFMSDTSVQKPQELDDPSIRIENCLVKLIHDLPDKYKNIMIDSEISEVKQKDLVDKYSLAYPTVRSRIQRGRKKLKEILLNCCEIEFDKRGNVLDTSCEPGCDNC